MKINIDSTIYSKRLAQELRNLVKKKFKTKVDIKVPQYVDKRAN
uniref:Uncharacterized protein n=1 Tax=viral metagenome TaxID=1070528 RepID=A0A6H1ZW04_9ZZZZ